MKRWLLPLFLCAYLALLPAGAGAELVSGIAAIVNNDIITTYDVTREAAPAIREAEQKSSGALPEAERAQIRAAALHRLIDRKLTDQKIRELGIKVSEEEVQQAIEDVKRQNHLTQESLVAALASQGLSFDQYKAQLTDQLERLRLMSQEVKSKVQVGEREEREYYEANLPKFGQEELFRARHIFFKIAKNATPEDIRKISTKAARVLEMARKGADFDKLARQYSDDPAAKEDGGDLGTFKRGDMLPEIEKTVERMKPGEVSDLVSTPAGFHIIKLEERTLGKAKPFDEVKGEIENILYKKKSEERFNTWLAELRKGAAIEIIRQ